MAVSDDRVAGVAGDDFAGAALPRTTLTLRTLGLGSEIESRRTDDRRRFIPMVTTLGAELAGAILAFRAGPTKFMALASLALFNS